nr:amidohydrolase [bacterium]
MYLIQNAMVWRMTGEAPFVGDILLGDDGLIAAVGQHLTAPERAQIIQAEGLWALPGIIDPHCHIGMWEDGLPDDDGDGNEATNPSTPALRAIDAVNPRDRCFEEALADGVTTVATGPGSANVIGGQFCALKTSGGTIERMLVKAPLAMKAALGENPKRVYGSGNKTPMTRMASAAILRQSLTRARHYMEQCATDDASKRPQPDLGLDMLAGVLKGELLMKVHAHRADDIMTAIRIMKEFHIHYTIEHCTEGYLIADVLKENGVFPILGPLICDRSKDELRNMTITSPRRLWEAGIPFAIMTDHPVIACHYLSLCAALAAREGLPDEVAMQAITINAARAIGLEGSLGTLETGKVADVALFSGHPLDIRTRAVRVFIRGEQAYRREF